MDVKFVHLCSLFFHLLILLGSYGNGVMEMDIGEIGSRSRNDEHNHSHVDMGIEQVHSHASSSSSHMHHIHKDPSFNVFFLIEDLKQGNTIPIYFPSRKLDTSHLLSKEEADTIPFASQELHNLLHSFSISQSSPQAKAMEDTLRVCEVKPIKGETKLCATSLQSMLDFVQMTCGLGKQVKLFSTTHHTKSQVLLQNYTVMGIQEIAAPKIVACHTMTYPYTVFLCHSQKKSRAFTVSLTGENDDRVEAIALCHMDTSHWGRNHVAFQLLGTEPGGSSTVCHFFPSDHLIWVPSNSQA